MPRLLTLLLVVLTVTASAQTYCGFDALHHLKHTHPGEQFQESEANQRLLDRIVDGATRDGEVLTVPVVVHIIHQNGPEDIPDSQVFDAIDHLNSAFANLGFYQDDEGVTSNIEFCLAARDPEDNFTAGINRVESALTDMLVPSQEADLKALSYWDSEQYLNIWVVGEITREPSNAGVVGFATFPDAHGSATDGIVVEAGTFGNNEVGSAVHIHECGHYLGLYHTFQDGCPNDDCLSSGDRVCDTPPDQDVYTIFCNDGTNSCDTDEDDLSTNNPFRPISEGGLGDQQDFQTNFMDYSNLACFERFTEGQVERMRATIVELRATLLDGMQCSPPCEDPIEAMSTNTGLEFDVGGNVVFTNASTNFTSASWQVDGENAGSGETFTFEPEVQGTYLVELVLNNADPGCTQVLAYEVVASCPIEALIGFDQTQIPVGGELELDNLSSGADTYTWYIDNEPVLTTENFVFTFEETGGFTITLEATADNCSVFSAPLFVTVGTCTTGKEANLWFHYNAFGDNYGIDFNQNPAGTIADNNLTVPAAHCKANVCDPNGNLLMLSTGEQVLNRNFEVMPNGADLEGGTSAHYGALFVEKPGADTEYYLFTAAEQSQFSNGLTYHVIDLSLDGGFGDVTEKNVFIANIGQEAITAIRHCNLVDFWLVTYDQNASEYLAWEVTAEGVSDTPVVSALENEVIFSLPLTVTSRGDRIVHGNRILDFDASTGTLTDNINMAAVPELVGWEISANGRYLYLFAGAFTTEVYQLDLETFDPADPLAQAYTYPITGLPVYFYPQRGPDGNIYVEDVSTNDIARIVNPNLPAELSTLETQWDNAGALINSFGNYYHAYVSGKTIFIDGPTEVCAGQTVEYNIYGHVCIADLITWMPEGATVEELENGVVAVTFGAPGTATLTAMIETSCGEATDVLEVTVGPASGLDLGPDFGQCAGGSAPVIDAGEGYLSYLWSTGETTPSIVPDGPGTYSVTVTTEACTATDEVTVTEDFVAPIELGEDDDLCDGTVIVLNAGAGYNDYTWQDGTTGPSYTVFEGGAYTVTATVPCFSTDTIVIDPCDQDVSQTNIEEVDGLQVALFPNPNSGAFVLSAGSEVLESVTIYAADGKQVYSTPVLGEGELVLDLELASGTYHVVARSAHQVWRGRVIIQ